MVDVVRDVNYYYCTDSRNPTRRTLMSKLIAQYRKTPTSANRQRLQTYLQRHMMAVCMASADDLAFLKANEFSI